MEEQISKEIYKENLDKEIEEKQWAETFLQSNDWKKLSAYISQSLPKKSPYQMETIMDVKVQGAVISGMLFPERLLLELIKKGNEAIDELKSNPNAE